MIDAPEFTDHTFRLAGWWVGIGDGLVQFFIFEWLAFQLVARRKPRLAINRPLWPILLSFLIALAISSVWHVSLVIFSWTFGICLFFLWAISLYGQRRRPFVVQGRLIFTLLLSPVFLIWMQHPSQQPTDTLIGIAAKGSAATGVTGDSWVLQELQQRPDGAQRLSHRLMRMARYQPESARDDEITKMELIGLLHLSPMLRANPDSLLQACERISPDVRNAAQLNAICP